MIKKVIAIFSVCLLLFSFGVTVAAEEASGALYGGYEDDWFDNGYEGIENEPPAFAAETEPQQRSWLRQLSIAPVLLGVLVGAAVVFVLRRRSRPDEPKAVPFALHAKTILSAQNDRLADVKHTRRNLSATNSSEE